MPHIFADDKLAKARKEPFRYHIHETSTYDLAKKDAEHAKKHVDPERWEIVADYGRSGHEPKWDVKAHWRESANEPGDDKKGGG